MNNECLKIYKNEYTFKSRTIIMEKNTWSTTSTTTTPDTTCATAKMITTNSNIDKE